MWTPSVTGNYMIKAAWTGNNTYSGVSKTVNLAVIPLAADNTQNLFSVASNSTISDLAFNSTSRWLTFTVTGLPGTTGYVDVYIAKTLIDDITKVKAYLDGNEINSTATSTVDAWRLHFTYQHSYHQVKISLETNGATTTFLGIEYWIGIVVAIIIVVIGACLLFHFKKRKK